MAALACVLALASCGPPTFVTAPRDREVLEAPPSAVSGQTGNSGRYVSRRHQVSISLPDGRTWTIDDHRSPRLVATQASTDSRLEIETTQEDTLMNRERCESRARARGFIGAEPLSTVHDETFVGPADFDSRLWVAVGGPTREGRLEGHVFLIGAHIKQCLVAHYRTSVRAPDEERLLAERLALAEARIVRSMMPATARTADEAVISRDRPGAPRPAR
jgi:hypothetical protein